MRTSKNRTFLAGDTGATKTTLALYDLNTWPGPPLKQQTFQNNDVIGFSQMINAFLESGGTNPQQACFGIAGPVFKNTARMTNLDWEISAEELQSQCGFDQVHLINDLVATGMGAVLLPQNKLQPLNVGQSVTNGTVAVLAPGTGLGETFMLHNHDGYHPAPTEGGHVSFAPRNSLQIELLQFMLNRYKHVSVEQVCSGIGIANLFDFMLTREAAPKWLLNELQHAKDRTPVIVEAAMTSISGGRDCSIAIHTMELFAAILADEAANLALKTLCFGGLYLGGGIPPRILPFLDPQQFMTDFTRGTYERMLADIPINIILEPRTAILGAAAYAHDKMNIQPTKEE